MKIESYKPPIFWKDKDRIKNILKIWSANNLEKFLINLNIIETEFKRNDLSQDTQFYYFLTQNLSKIALKILIRKFNFSRIILFIFNIHFYSHQKS